MSMTKDKLTAAVAAAKEETREALMLLFDSVNQGQRKQLMKRENIKALFERYGVDWNEESN